MATVPSSLLQRRSGPPAPPSLQGASAPQADPAGATGKVIDAGATAFVLPHKDEVTAEQQEVVSILNAYAAVLPPDEPFGVMAQTLAIVSETMTPRGLAVFSPVIVDFTVYAQNLLVNGSPFIPAPVSLTQSYVNEFMNFLKTQGTTDLQHLATGLHDSLSRQQASHVAKQVQTDRTEKDVAKGYPHLIQQLSAVSEKIATLGPLNWGLIAETARTRGMDEISTLLSDSSRKMYQGQQQLEVETKAAHTTSYHTLDVQKRNVQKMQLTSALLAGTQAALSQGSGDGLSYDSLQEAMKRGATQTLTKEIQRLAKKALAHKKSSKPTALKKPLLMAGDATPANPNTA